MCRPYGFRCGPCKDLVEEFLQIIFLMVTACTRQELCVDGEAHFSCAADFS